MTIQKKPMSNRVNAFYVGFFSETNSISVKIIILNDFFNLEQVLSLI